MGGSTSKEVCHPLQCDDIGNYKEVCLPPEVSDGSESSIDSPFSEESEVYFPPAQHVGLENFGNTCYCNSGLQFFYHCTPLRTRLEELYNVLKANAEKDRHAESIKSSSSSLQSKDYFNGCNSSFSDNVVDDPKSESLSVNESVLRYLVDLFHDITNNKDKKAYLSPCKFLSKVKMENVNFNNKYQQDAHEFTFYILNTIIEEEKKLLNIPQSSQGTIQRIFEGQAVSYTSCLECETKSKSTQSFLDLSIDINENCSLKKCITSFWATQFLTGDDKFYCETCNARACARRTDGLWKTPNKALIIQLKRFKYVEETRSFKKLNCHVPIPDQFEMEPKSDDSVDGRKSRKMNHSRSLILDLMSPHSIISFNLRGFIVHRGSSMNAGHYFGCFRDGETWRKYDDDEVSIISEREIEKYVGEPDNDSHNSTTAYILMYERV
eukprot:Tbor_TRINITY_DN5475_c0_g1::TRINITY_DN5475_c0_g1_i1::g.24414::m.24414/K11842/USP12_46; ubiquitin carboxyl-terminal hydrolase 12/46